MSLSIDQNRLARIQDERFFVCMEEGHMYEIKDLTILGNEIWIQSRDGKLYKDYEVMTVSESGDYYRLSSWMKQKLNIQ